MIKDNLFIHIPKTGGTTVHACRLGEYATAKPDHILAIDAKKQWPECFFYTFMRNPYTRMVSLYECQFPRIQGHYHLPQEPIDLSFERYVQIIVEGHHNDERHFQHWRPQTDWILDSDDNLMVDYVGHMETLKNDAEEIARLIGVEGRVTINPGLLNKSRWRHDHYKDYFNDDTRKKVEKYYEKDIDFLKVKF